MYLGLYAVSSFPEAGATSEEGTAAEAILTQMGLGEVWLFSAAAAKVR